MSARKSRKQVYVSSTFSDLEQHRAHLKLALEKAGYDTFIDHELSRQIGHVGNFQYTHAHIPAMQEEIAA